MKKKKSGCEVNPESSSPKLPSFLSFLLLLFRTGKEVLRSTEQRVVVEAPVLRRIPSVSQCVTAWQAGQSPQKGSSWNSFWLARCQFFLAPIAAFFRFLICSLFLPSIVKPLWSREKATRTSSLFEGSWPIRAGTKKAATQRMRRRLMIAPRIRRRRTTKRMRRKIAFHNNTSNLMRRNPRKRRISSRDASILSFLNLEQKGIGVKWVPRAG